MRRQSSGRFILATGPTKIVTIHGGTMKGACLVGVLAMIACLAETRAYVSFDQVNPDNSSVSANDPKRVEATTEKPKLIRVPLERRSRRAIDGSLATVNANDGERPGRARITERPVPEDVAADARQGAKRKHKKLKLSQTQGRKKSKKTKRYIDNAASRQLTNGDQNPKTRSYNSRKDDSYYAQRKAIMDRFHARNREIARKYRQPPFAITTTTTTEGPFRYHLDFGGLNTATETHWFRLRTTGQPPDFNPPTQEETTELFDDDDDDEVLEEDYEEATTSTTSKPTTKVQRAQPENHGNHSLGKCNSFESLNMLYRHNLVLESKKGVWATAEIFMPTEEGKCVVCIVADNQTGKWQINTDPKAAVLRVKGEPNAQVSIAVQFYTDPAKALPCLGFRAISCQIFTD